MPEGHAVLRNVMFTPMVVDGETVGVIGLANKPGGFDSKDMKIASSFGEVAAKILEIHLTNT